MRPLIPLVCFPLVCLTMCLHGCGGASVALYVEWGDCDFDRERWAEADRRERGCMLASLLAQHPPDTMTAAGVERLLGPPVVHTGNGHGPAYLVVPAAAPVGGANEHLLVFLADSRSGRIHDARLQDARACPAGQPRSSRFRLS